VPFALKGKTDKVEMPLVCSKQTFSGRNEDGAMNRSYWLKFGSCIFFLLLLASGALTRDSYFSLSRPWNGLMDIGTTAAEIFSPFVSLYLVVLVMKHK
jgi:hypothetical protein